MDPIKDILEKNTVVVLNETLRSGFTQLPNYVLKSKDLSPGAKLAYAVLLSYAWEKDSCFPGQDRMANDLEVGRQAVSGYLQELKKHKFISWKRRGLGKTNIYYILEYNPIKIRT